jgi:hypothetical protein
MRLRKLVSRCGIRSAQRKSSARSLVLAFAVALAVVAFAAESVPNGRRAAQTPPLANASPEPVYEGHTISYWLSNSEAFFSGGTGLPQALLNDSNAVPVLVEALKRDSRLGAPPPGDNLVIRYRAAIALGAMRQVAKPAIPALVQALKEEESLSVRGAEAEALGHIGKGDSNAAALLVKALKDKNAVVRQGHRVCSRKSLWLWTKNFR